MHETTPSRPEIRPLVEIETDTAKLPFEEPRLAFVEPKLTPRGDLRDVTGFFGSFTP